VVRWKVVAAWPGRPRAAFREGHGGPLGRAQQGARDVTGASSNPGLFEVKLGVTLTLLSLLTCLAPAACSLLPLLKPASPPPTAHHCPWWSAPVSGDLSNSHGT
jgi:hypothetical protein